jgi:hypothetical protein
LCSVQPHGSPGSTPEERTLALAAGGTTAEATHQLFRVHVEEQHRIEFATERLDHGREPFGLRNGAHHAVEDGPVGRLG